jgi:hypothetical protein
MCIPLVLRVLRQERIPRRLFSFPPNMVHTLRFNIHFQPSSAKFVVFFKFD